MLHTDDKMVANKGALSRKLVEIASLAFKRGMSSVYSGNISVRLNGNTVLMTPAGMPKHILKPSELSVFDVAKEKLLSGPKQSSEYKAHMYTYRLLKGVNAIVHVHPKKSIALYAAMGIGAFRITGSEPYASDEEVEYYLGKVSAVGKLPSGSRELGEAVANQFAKGAKVVIMEGHGTIAVGEDLDEAFGRVHYLELFADKKINYELLKKSR